MAPGHTDPTHTAMGLTYSSPGTWALPCTHRIGCLCASPVNKNNSSDTSPLPCGTMVISHFTDYWDNQALR